MLGTALRPGRRTLERGAVAALAVAVVCVVASSTGALDLAVYRVGGQTWLQGLDLYSPTFPAPLDGPALPFTYPPIAAVLFAVLAALPLVVLLVAVVDSATARRGRSPAPVVESRTGR